MLSDTVIRMRLASGDINFTDPATGEPLELDDSQFQPVSVDLRLGDVEEGVVGWTREGNGPRRWWLPPFRFALGSTFEVIELSSRVAALAVGKSSIARNGLQVEAAGLTDPGFPGQLTLELINFGREPVILTEGEPICQVYFHDVLGPVARPYGHPGLKSRYMHQRGPTAARPDPEGTT